MAQDKLVLYQLLEPYGYSSDTAIGFSTRFHGESDPLRRELCSFSLRLLPPYSISYSATSRLWNAHDACEVVRAILGVVVSLQSVRLRCCPLTKLLDLIVTHVRENGPTQTLGHVVTAHASECVSFSNVALTTTHVTIPFA